MAEKRVFPWVPVLLIGAGTLYAFYHLTNILLPFILSFALAYVANPLITYFEVRGLRRGVTVFLLYLACALTIFLLANGLIQLLMDELLSLQSQAPGYLASWKGLLSAAQAWVSRKLPYAGRLAKQWDASLYAPLIDQAQRVPGYILGIFPLLSLLFLIPFITFLLLIDGPDSINRLISACPSRYVEQALHLISEIDASLGAYLRGLVIVALAITTASFIGLWAMGVRQALAIAVLSGVSSFVPYLGAVMGAVVGGLAAGFQFGTLAAGLNVVLLFLLIRLADEIFLQPAIARHSVHLHPLVFLLTLMVGGEVFGFMGLVFAVPAACVLKALVQVAWAWYATEARLKGPESFEAAAVPYT